MSDVEPRRAPQGRHHFHPPDPRDARDTPLRPGEAAALPNRPRPPRPWYAQITGQWPLAITLLGVAIGLAIVAASFWRRGITVVGLTLAGAAVLRLLLPDRVQGLLRVRSRWVDVVTLAVIGVGILVAAWIVPPIPK